MEINKGEKPTGKRRAHSFGETAKKQSLSYRYNDKLISGLSYRIDDGDKKITRKVNVASYGKLNSQPEKLSKLANDSTWHKTCIEKRVQYILEDGLNDDGLGLANERGETYTDVFEYASSDFIEQGGFGIEVIWSNDGSQITSIRHIPWKFLKAEEMDAFGIIPAWWIRRDWSGRTRFSGQDNVNTYRLPVFNSALASEQPRQILVVKRPNKNSDYYPEPDYIGALDAILADKIIMDSKVRYMSVAPLLSAVFLVTGKFKGPDGEDIFDQVADEISEEITGVENSGKFGILSQGEAGDISLLEPPEISKNFRAFDDSMEDVRQRILSAHGILFPEIIGIPNPNTGLGTDDIRAKFQIFFNTSLRKPQRQILRGFNIIGRYLPGGHTFEIAELDPTEGVESRPNEADRGAVETPETPQ